MVGQHLHPLHGFQAADQVCSPAQTLLVVGQAGHQHMPDPQRHPEVRDAACHGQDVGIVFSGEPTVLFGVDLFQVQNDQTGGLHQPVKSGKVCRIIGPERLPGSIQSRVDPFGACQLEKLCHKGHLAQRFPAADGDAALFAPIIAVAVDALEQLLRRPFLAALRPGFGVVTVFAAQGTAL